MANTDDTPPKADETTPTDDHTKPNADDTTPTDDATTPITVLNLNDFPDYILAHIISFLPTCDAIRTNRISRKWQNLWTTIPALNFDYSLFPPSPDSPDDTRRRFANFVNQTILTRPRFPSPLKFRFQFHFGDFNFWSQVDSWIHSAVTNGVLELDIDFYVHPVYHGSDPNEEYYYEFNLSSVANSKIRDLKIRWCELILPYGMSGCKFGSINSIYLSQIYLADDMVTDLISVCVNLESLALEHCFGMEKLRICSKKLKNLSLCHFIAQNGEEDSVEICCPNLRMISINCFKTEKYLIKQADSLVEARVEFLFREERFEYWNKVIRLFDGIKHLKVQNWWYKFFEQKDDSLKQFAFNNLRTLELQTGYTKHDVLGLARLLEISLNLHTMILGYLHKPPDENKSLSEEPMDEPITLSMPSLKQVKFKHFWGSEGQVQFLNLLKTQGPVLDKIVIVFPRVEGNFFPDPLVLRRRQPQVDVNSTPISDVPKG